MKKSITHYKAKVRIYFQLFLSVRVEDAGIVKYGGHLHGFQVERQGSDTLPASRRDHWHKKQNNHRRRRI